MKLLQIMWSIVGCVVCLHGQANAVATIYPAPNGALLSTKYEVKVDNQAVAVYNANIPEQTGYADVNWGREGNRNVHYTYFDGSGSVTVSVKLLTGTLTTATIRPFSKGVTATVANGVATFTITQFPCHVSFEPNGIFANVPLIIYANPPEVNPPQNGDANVLYYGPGIYERGNSNILHLEDNQTLYIAGGAIFRGNVHVHGKKNVKILGRGIMDGTTLSDKSWGEHSMMYITDASDVLVNGPIIANAPYSCWTVYTKNCKRLTIDNIKLMSGRWWEDDGIDLVSDSGVLVTNCFLKEHDDGVVVKCFDGKSSSDILVTNCTLWPTTGNGLMIGAEERAAEVKNYTARNCDIIHSNQMWVAWSPLYHNAFGILNGQDADVHDVLYDDIRVEDCHGNYGGSDQVEWMVFFVGASGWTPDNQYEGTGIIRNVTVKNVRLIDGYVPSMVLTAPGDNNNETGRKTITNLNFVDLKMFGKDILRSRDAFLIDAGGAKDLMGDGVHNVRFLSSDPAKNLRIDGTIIGQNGNYPASFAFDGNPKSPYASSGTGKWVGIDAGSGKESAVDTFSIYAGSIYGGDNATDRATLVNARLQGSNTADFASATDLYQITSSPAFGWNNFKVTNTTKFRYFRILSAPTSYLNFLEIELYKPAGSTSSIPNMSILKTGVIGNVKGQTAIFDCRGKLLYSMDANRVGQIATSIKNLPKGAYIVGSGAGNRMASRKIVVY